MDTSKDESDKTQSPVGRQPFSWWLAIAAVVLLSASWLIPNYPPIRWQLSDEPPMVYAILEFQAIPWLLQWAGVCCGFLFALRKWCRKDWRDAMRLAALLTFTFGAACFGGAIVEWWEMTLSLEDIVTMYSAELSRSLGGESFSGFAACRFFGKVLDPFRGIGPTAFQGTDFIIGVLSTTGVMGYLLFVGRWCNVGKPGGLLSRRQNLRDILKFVVAMTMLYLPPIIHLGIGVLQNQ